MSTILNEFHIPNFTDYKLDNSNNTNDEIKQFFLNNHYIIVDQYVNILPKPNKIIKFNELKILYLLDKDLRTYVYTVLEEIETSLKSFIQIYVEKHKINLCDNKIYITKHYNNPTYKFQKTIAKCKGNKFAILTLYFSDISKIISLLKNKQSFVNDIHKYFMPHYTLQNFKKFIFILSLLRNEIAHHGSFIIFCMQQNNYTLKSILNNLQAIINNIRYQSNQSLWLNRVTNHINNKLEQYNTIKTKIGYEQ